MLATVLFHYFTNAGNVLYISCDCSFGVSDNDYRELKHVLKFSDLRFFYHFVFCSFSYCLTDFERKTDFELSLTAK